MYKLIEQNIQNMKVKDMQDLLKEIGSFHSLKNKQEYVKRLSCYKDVLNFGWRKEQKQVIDAFLNFKHTRYIVQGIFGAGKSTMLLGMVINGIIKNLFRPSFLYFKSGRKKNH